MVKDLLRSMIEINGDSNLTIHEGAFLYCLIQYHNVELGYAYPTRETLKVALKTKRLATVSNACKSLVDKGYIRVEKEGRNNRYYLLKCLYIVDKDNSNNKANVATKIEPKVNKTPKKVKPVKVAEREETIDPALEELRALSNAPVDSNGKALMEGQVHISDIGVDVEVSKELKETTGFNDTQVAELLAVADNKKALVLQAYDYTINTGNVANKFGYTKKMIMVFKNNGASSEVYSHNSHDKALRFNNFEARSYDYDKLEKGLLGWTDSETYEDCCINPVAN